MRYSATVDYDISEEMLPHPREPGYAVPRRFSATVRVPHLPNIEFEIDVEMVGDAPHCRRLEVRPLEGADVTGEVLRSIPIARMLAALVPLAALKIEGATMHQLMPLEERAELYKRLADSARPPRRGSPLTDEHLAQVAELYRAALDAGDSPTQTVAVQMHAARSTAARWVAHARERGFLGPSLPGRAGESAPTQPEGN